MVECPLGFTAEDLKKVQKGQKTGSPDNETLQEAINRTDIEGIFKEQHEQNRRLTDLEGRINWIFTTIIVTLLVGITNLVVHVIRFFIFSPYNF